MNRILKNGLIVLAIYVLGAVTAMAQGIELRENKTSGLPRTDVATDNSAVKPIAEGPTRPFAFGVEAGAMMDFSSTESSQYNIDIYAGYRKGVIQALGLGIGLHPSFAHGRTFIPIYALFRCNFKEGRSLCFGDLKVGMSINELSSDTHNTGWYASAGIGFNLWQTRRLKTHAIVGYNYTQVVPFANYNECAIHGVSIRIGITF